MKLAQGPTTDINQIIGTIEPQNGFPVDLGSFIAKLINIFLIVAGLAMLIYMLWGAFDWVVSGGEKEKIDKARNKITQAIVGIIVFILVLTFFNVIAGQVLHIVDVSPGGGWQFHFPTINKCFCDTSNSTCSTGCRNSGAVGCTYLPPNNVTCQ